MKKMICIAFALSLCLSLVACDQDNTPAPDLYAAVEKLATAESYSMTIAFTDGVNPTTTTYQITRANGILCAFEEYESRRATGSRYYEDNVSYQLLPDGSKTQIKTIYEDGIQVTDIACNYPLLGDVKGFLDAFLALEPKYRTKGDMVIASKSLSREEYISIAYKLFSYVYEDYFDIGNPSVSVSVDSAGYLREISLKTGLFNEGYAVTCTIDQINEVSAVETPEYVKDFHANIGVFKDPISDTLSTEIRFVNGEIGAFYEDNPFIMASYGKKAWSFTGLSYIGDEPYVLPVYEVLEEIEGIAVKTIGGIIYPNSKLTVERLVIPKGVQVCTGGGDAWETVLFFCDKEENVNKDYFGTLDEPHFEGEGYNYKAAYYAGEWEYVAGIPTPLN
jgi:hypothetical protein